MTGTGTIAAVSNTPLCYCAINASGQIYNKDTSSFEPIPSDNTPKAQHLIMIPRLGPVTGSLGSFLHASVPDLLNNLPGVCCCVFACDVNGALAGAPNDLLDVVPLVYPPSVQVIVRN